MNIRDFLDFNHFCPVCGNPLHLYMQWIDSLCYEAVAINNRTFDFKGLKSENQKFTMYVGMQ